MKTCFKCGISKPFDAFYKHKRMADGYLGKCKICTKMDVRSHRAINLDRIHAYDNQRSKLPHRRAAKTNYVRRLKLRDPIRYKAHYAVSNAIRDGRLTRKPCIVCGDPKSEAHHHDYSKPLDVTWLCFKHHRTIGHNQKLAA